MTYIDLEVRRLGPKLIVVPGVIAGALKLLVELALAPGFVASPWGRFRMIAAIVLGRSALVPTTFDLGVVVLALAIHFALSIAYAAVLVLVLRRLVLWSALPIGILFGLLLYVLNFYVFTLIFPWFAAMRTGMQLIAHAVFGGAIAASFEAMRRRPAAA